MHARKEEGIWELVTDSDVAAMLRAWDAKASWTSPWSARQLTVIDSGRHGR
jgi:hypothetical protein